MTVAAYIFDIEGTLVDSVPAQLRCWRETLGLHGHDVSTRRLQRLSGMDGNDMLQTLLPDAKKGIRKSILDDQDKRFEAKYLASIRPLPGIRETLLRLAARGSRIGIATDCKGASLAHYRRAMGIDDLLDGMACGEEVREGKPNPKLVRLALDKLGCRAAESLVIGDTPCDVESATACGAACVTVRTGGFSQAALMSAGSVAVLDHVAMLADWNERPDDVTAKAWKSATIAAS
jgi:HAD superfamily hydrolase (TIGR01509 family)